MTSFFDSLNEISRLANVTAMEAAADQSDRTIWKFCGISSSLFLTVNACLFLLNPSPKLYQGSVYSGMYAVGAEKYLKPSEQLCLHVSGQLRILQGQTRVERIYYNALHHIIF